MRDRTELPSLDLIDSADALLEQFGSTEEVMKRYSSCSICGSHLHFSHFTDFNQNLTQETAKCPECGIRIRRVLHKLQ